MCGIVGLFLKRPELESRLGALVAPMLVSLSDRGPDSTGVAVYGPGAPRRTTTTPRRPAPRGGTGEELTAPRHDTHAVVSVPAGKEAAARAALEPIAPHVAVVGAGE